MDRIEGNGYRWEHPCFVKPSSLAGVLIIPVAILVGVNLALGGLLFFGADREANFISFLRFFDLNSENTVPSWYSTLLLAGAGVMTLLAWRKSVAGQRPFQRAWLMLGMVFFLMSMDESLAIHERSMDPLRIAFDAGGFFYWAWVIPGIAVVIVLGTLFTPFLRHLPPRTFRLVIASGVLYVGGALVMEMVGGFFYDTFGAGVLSDCTSIVEETAEMLGVILYIYAINEYIIALPQSDADDSRGDQHVRIETVFPPKG
jgi:hypothetical protein